MWRLLIGYSSLLLALICASSAQAVAGDVPKCGKRWEKKSERLFEAGNYEQLFKVILPCAEKGHAEAQLLAALILRDDVCGQPSRLTEKEREHEALFWLRKSAANGNEDALLEMANAYERGLYGLIENTKIGTCLRSAIEDKEKIEECLELENEELE